MNARLAVHLGAHQLPELQRVARLLLARPLVTIADGDDFRLVRRWETVLRNEFGQKLGYRLDVSRSAARLLRRPVALSADRGARLAGARAERVLSRWAYIYLCLILAALEAPGTQVLASELFDRIEQSARGNDELQLDAKEYAQRRAFRDAVRYLEQVGVLTVRDGDIDALARTSTSVETSGLVLFDIDRDAAAMCLVASPSILREVRSIEDFVAEPAPTSTEARRRQARQRLNRRLLDQPVVMLHDLDDDEAELAWRNRRREAENITRLTGCSVELRREGMALIDHAVQPISRRRFPASDGVAHAALLWLDDLVASSSVTAPLATSPAEDDSSHRPIDAATADASWKRIGDRYGSRFGKVAVERPEAFRDDCAELLVEFGLIRNHSESGLEVAAFASRFRADATVVDVSTSDMSSTASSQQAMF